jgi:acyl carrier protein
LLSSQAEAAATGCRINCTHDPRRNDAVAVDTRDRIREFIKQEILFEDRDAAVADDTPLLSGIIDSLGLTQMVAFIEDEYDVEIDDADISAPNFRTIADINRLIQQKLQEKV